MDLTVRAMWDADASVWVAESDDVPSLITEADSLEGLVRKLRVMIPELLEASAGYVTTMSPGVFASRSKPSEILGFACHRRG